MKSKASGVAPCIDACFVGVEPTVSGVGIEPTHVRTRAHTASPKHDLARPPAGAEYPSQPVGTPSDAGGGTRAFADLQNDESRQEIRAALPRKPWKFALFLPITPSGQERRSHERGARALDHAFRA
jgi:hypothetical protein